MAIEVSVNTVQPRRIAAVTRLVAQGGVASAWKPALDKVWAFLGTQPGLRTDGHNIFLYHHPQRRGDAMQVDFGVEVVRSFGSDGEVHEASTPSGEAAVALHRGSYDRLHATHAAIHDWAKANGRNFAGQSWEIYGDWHSDPQQLETTVVYLLKTKGMNEK